MDNLSGQILESFTYLNCKAIKGDDSPNPFTIIYGKLGSPSSMGNSMKSWWNLPRSSSQWGATPEETSTWMDNVGFGHFRWWLWHAWKSPMPHEKDLYVHIFNLVGGFNPLELKKKTWIVSKWITVAWHIRTISKFQTSPFGMVDDSHQPPFQPS